MPIKFKQVKESDFQMLHDRLKSDHIQGFYDGGKESFAEYSEGMERRMKNPHQFSYIFLVDDAPVGYIQCYDCYGIAEDVYGALVEKGTRGVDMYIGEEDYVGKGYGSSVLREFTAFVIKNHQATQVSIDPTPTNVRAIGAYKKAGFETIKEFVIDGNTHLLMVYRRKKYVIIHGTMGHPKENWIPRLKSQLESNGHTVYVPQFPTPENQNLDSRCEVLTKEVPFIFDEDTVLIGHSLGALYILHILDRERSKKIHSAILVSGFTSKLGNEEFDNLNGPFLKDDFDWERIKGNAGKITILHGDNDPYVPISQAENLKEKLDGNLLIIENGGHLNESAGYKEFDEILGIVYN